MTFPLCGGTRGCRSHNLFLLQLIYEKRKSWHSDSQDEPLWTWYCFGWEKQPRLTKMTELLESHRDGVGRACLASVEADLWKTSSWRGYGVVLSFLAECRLGIPWKSCCEGWDSGTPSPGHSPTALLLNSLSSLPQSRGSWRNCEFGA